MQNMQKYAEICKNMQKYANICKICKNRQKYAKICRIWRFSNIAKMNSQGNIQVGPFELHLILQCDIDEHIFLYLEC